MICPICRLPDITLGGEDVCTGHDDWLDDPDAFDDDFDGNDAFEADE